MEEYPTSCAKGFLETAKGKWAVKTAGCPHMVKQNQQEYKNTDVGKRENSTMHTDNLLPEGQEMLAYFRLPPWFLKNDASSQK